LRVAQKNKAVAGRWGEKKQNQSKVKTCVELGGGSGEEKKKPRGGKVSMLTALAQAMVLSMRVETGGCPGRRSLLLA